MGAAEALNALLAGGPDIESHCDRIVALENEADEITREVLLAVRRSFITPSTAATSRISSSRWTMRST